MVCRRLSAWVAGYIPRWFTCPQMITHPGTNQVWHSAITLIEANTLPLSQTTTLLVLFIVCLFAVGAAGRAAGAADGVHELGAEDAGTAERERRAGHSMDGTESERCWSDECRERGVCEDETGQRAARTDEGSNWRRCWGYSWSQATVLPSTTSFLCHYVSVINWFIQHLRRIMKHLYCVVCVVWYHQNRFVFSNYLKLLRRLSTVSGNEFQTARPATEKVRWPKVLSR